MTRFLLCALLLAGQAHAQTLTYTYSNVYSPWLSLESRLKYAWFVALLDANDVEVNRAPIATLFDISITSVLPAQVGSVTVAKIRTGFTETGTRSDGVVDLVGGGSVTYTLLKPFPVPAGAVATLVYVPMALNPSLTVSVAPPAAPPADVIPPTVSISSPGAGATVVGAIGLSANAADNVGVAGVQFQVDGANHSAEITVAPYSTVWNSTVVADGAHIITAVARDAAGNKATSASIAVKVSNAPPPPTQTVSAQGDCVGTVVDAGRGCAKLVPQLVDASKAVWTLAGTKVMRGALDMQVPYTDTNFVYFWNGFVRANSVSRGYICFGTAWGVGC